MSTIISEKQRQVYDFIVKFVKTEGHSPMIRDIARHFGFSSPATVHKYLVALEAAGMIVRGKRNALVQLLPEEHNSEAIDIPLLGKIAAGRPIDVIAQEEAISIPKEMLGRSRTYALRVVGDSMIDEHIADGDLIIVEHCQQAQNGQTVVALVNDSSATVKKIFFDKGQVKLQPANTKYQPLMLDPTQVKVQGRVIGVMRRY
ncbi:MAG: transcriptional repressor LexA [Blastocatellia bacterium]|nr:transcriptional repressor LexA [Blastocatellia bacterium]MBN8725841.1 transcriptional repressor LexA [Acidobacteriota bacterium]